MGVCALKDAPKEPSETRKSAIRGGGRHRTVPSGRPDGGRFHDQIGYVYLNLSGGGTPPDHGRWNPAITGSPPRGSHTLQSE